MKAQLALFLSLAAAGYCFPSGDITNSACSPNPCFNGGTCIDMGLMYMCVCNPDYVGTQCETPDDPCASNPCRNGALCFRQDQRGTSDRTFHCLCQGDFTGTFCDLQLLKSACDNNPCQNGGVCEPSTDSEPGYICRCTNFYGGTNCQILPCDMNPCQNGGECFSGFRNRGDFMCRCPEGLRGPNCEINDPCMDNPCGEGNMCKPGRNGSFSCMCSCYPGGTCQSRPTEGNGETDGEGPDGVATTTDNPDGEMDSGSPGAESAGGTGDSGNSVGENSIPQVSGGGSSSLNPSSGSHAMPHDSRPCFQMMQETNNCNNHGYCHEDSTGAICRCHEGFMGVTCAQAIGSPQDDSNGVSDSNRGSDAGPESGSVGSGNTGSNIGSGGSGTGDETAWARNNTRPCVEMMEQTEYCNHRGYCVEDGTSAFCRCYEGFRGSTCQHIDDTSSGMNSDRDSIYTGSGTGTGSTGEDTRTDSSQTDESSAGSNTLPQVGPGSSNVGQGSGSNTSHITSKPCVALMRETNNCTNHQGYCIEDRHGALCYCHHGYQGVVCDAPSQG
ncbi:neurogenic locus notch homolog protein 1-like [Acanthaster planci]|uniref:Neurogenic locus notch homolog protein 1-like n=1 Tax=Acanthaster planci TaxID=133434 RepID=A0A8B7YVC2_ACAPL|nr:neurogenic locus notch homolog protein 1-like [Acanthaster planci]